MNYSDQVLSEINVEEGLISQVKLQQRIQALTKSNAQMIALIAHDLRGPFGNVVGFLSLIERNLINGNKSENKELIKLALSSANRAVNLLGELTTWASVNNKGLSFNPVRANLKYLLGNEIENLFASARQKKIQVNYRIAHNLMVSADIIMLQSIFRNLISNAVKFTPPGASVTVEAFDDGNGVVVTVKDNGVGIKEEEQHKLFDNSIRYTTSGTNYELGTGNGIKICNHFVSIHGGQLKLKSKEGIGTEFSFSLPHISTPS